MHNGTVLISGAGVAGLTLAYWLRRHGLRPTVVERAGALRDGGYKVDVRGAALEVLARMGVPDAVRQARTGMRGASFVNRRGRRVATMDADLFGGRSGADVEIMRGDLLRILAAQARAGAEYLFGDSITSITQNERCVEVEFAHSGPRAFDLLVAADGLHSNVRALAFGPEAQFVRHLRHYIAIFTVPNDLGLDSWELLYAVPGKTVGVYSTRRDGAARAMFLFAAPRLDYDRRDDMRQKQILRATFDFAGWETARLLRHLCDAPDFYFDSISQVHAGRWSRGRVVLLGDAACCASPASGQGTSLALVGAYVLAGELAAAGGDCAAGLHNYETALRPFAEQNQRLAADNLKGMVLHSRSQIWLQMQMIRLLPHLPGKEHIAGRVAERIHAAATAITLKDYAG